VVAGASTIAARELCELAAWSMRFAKLDVAAADCIFSDPVA
jgi:hypothetical protein